MADGQKKDNRICPATNKVKRRSRSTSISDFKPTATIRAGMESKPNVPTQNRFSIFADCLLHDTDHTNTDQANEGANTYPENTQTSTNIKPPATRQYQPRQTTRNYSRQQSILYQIRLTKRLKIIFHNLTEYHDFKEVCRKENIQFHIFTVSTEKILTVVLKGLIKLNEKVIINYLKAQALKPINCTELPNTRFRESPLHLVQRSQT